MMGRYNSRKKFSRKSLLFSSPEILYVFMPRRRGGLVGKREGGERGGYHSQYLNIESFEGDLIHSAAFYYSFFSDRLALYKNPAAIQRVLFSDKTRCLASRIYNCSQPRKSCNVVLNPCKAFLWNFEHFSSCDIERQKIQKVSKISESGFRK